MANSVAYTAYERWTRGPQPPFEGASVITDLADYCRGQIGGLESLFQNLEAQYSDFKAYVADVRERMRTEDENGT